MRRTLLFSLILLLACCTSAVAAVPQTLSYQGVLRDDVGGVVPDGTYEITFWIYNVETGGLALWAETQQLPVADGVVNAIIGSEATLDLPFDEQYWLGITVDGEPQLSPRTALTSAPYAFRSAYSDVSGDDGDWTISGDTVYHLNGDVGIGTASPLVDLEIRRDQDAYTGMVITNTDTGINSREGIIFKNEDGETAGLQLYDDDSPVGPGMVLSNNRPNGYLRFNTSGFERMRVNTDGRVGIGVQLPSQLLDVAGTVRAEGFQMPTGATTGYVLTSDGSGYGTWTPPQAVADGDWTVSGNSMSSSVSGNVGIGTATPQDKLEIKGVLRLDQGVGNGNNIRFAEGGDLKWAILYRPWVNGNLTILDEVSLARSMTFESGTGDVGVKTEHPETDLHVVGEVRVDGDLQVNGTITHSAATSYYTVQPQEFVPVYASFTDYIMGGGMYTLSGTTASFVAPIHLPQGATVTGVTYHYTDNSTTGDNSLMVLRRSLSGTPDYVMATLSSSGSSGSGSATESTIDYATVDNTAYGYNILLYAYDAIVTYGVVFEYTTTSVN